jgi:hypothetical protein
VTKRLALICVTALLIAVPLQSQTSPPPAMPIGGIAVTLGMSKDELVARLGDSLVLQPSGTSFLVRSAEGPPYQLFGTIAFDSDGRLSYANRNWEPEADASGVAVVRSLRNALVQVTTPTGSGSRMCRCIVLLSDSESPQGSTQSILISDGTRMIDTSVVRLNSRANPLLPLESVTIAETIRR